LSNCFHPISISDNIYIEADARYADLTDGFVIGQSWWVFIPTAVQYLSSFGKYPVKKIEGLGEKRVY